MQRVTPFERAGRNRPGLDPAPVHQYAAAIVGNNITIRGIAGQGAGGNFDILIQDYSSMNPLIEQNVLGASALNFNRLPGDYALENLHLGATSTNVIVRHNLMKAAAKPTPNSPRSSVVSRPRVL